jgi:hypothetical protein
MKFLIIFFFEKVINVQEHSVQMFPTLQHLFCLVVDSTSPQSASPSSMVKFNLIDSNQTQLNYSTESEVHRGCTFDEITDTDFCRADPLRCVICGTSGCNTDPTSKPASISCQECECIMIFQAVIKVQFTFNQRWPQFDLWLVTSPSRANRMWGSHPARE